MNNATSLFEQQMKNLKNNQIFEHAIEKARTHSLFLAKLLELHPDIASGLKKHGADTLYEKITMELHKLGNTELTEIVLMKELRIAKGKVALLIALADIAEVWQLDKTINALSFFAQNCLVIAINHLLYAGYKQGHISYPDSRTLPNSEPNSVGNIAIGSGLIVLAMGKLGGGELNYSSDIDLILFYEPNKIDYKGRHNEQHFMNRLAHDLVSIMQDRTRDGYVFRTDLRLRPDPASTPPVVTTQAAYHYYESVGQNWERAAMIKARPVAGDIEAGEEFLKSLTPFMWRRNLDFAAINDIHSIKRQMDSRQNHDIQIKGHNIKLGLGGIREIEFLSQIYQLIWGGREPSLRLRTTCGTLNILRDVGLIDETKEDTLINAYYFLRTLEHRIQMVADEQTHTLPEDDTELKNIAEFMGYADIDAFSKILSQHLYSVHEIYLSSFRSGDELSDAGNLVFTGGSHDTGTLRTLENMGYNNPQVVSETVMSWHHGSSRATRTTRARELLTEMLPTILKRLSQTANPDAAFLRFNDFLQKLPASIQLFSLFKMNPQLLKLIADIMGSAPTLANTLSQTPELLDAVLYEDFYDDLPAPHYLEVQIKEKLLQAKNKKIWDFEQSMDRLRQFRNEKQFQAGVQLLHHMISAKQAGEFLTNLAECVIRHSLSEVLTEFEKTYGRITGSRFAVIALGKLGSREMTFMSDVDLIFVYDTPDSTALSDGKKPFTASVYYNRLAQRLLNALSGMGRDGRLYEVDTRLRPSGEQGLLAVSKESLSVYFAESAWTFEYMAFTKARVVAGNKPLMKELEIFISKQINKDRDFDKLHFDVNDMRERIEKENKTDNPWDIKYVRGGLIDIDFMAQYLILRHSPDYFDTKSGNAHEFFEMLKNANCIDPKTAEELIDANQFLEQLFNMLRLCHTNKFDADTAPEGLKKLLVETVNEKNFETLHRRLIDIEKSVYKHYKSLFDRNSYAI